MPSVKIRNINAAPFDIEQLYAENLAVSSAGSNALGGVIDLKGYGYGKGVIVMDITLAEDGDADETYEIVHELSDDAAFTVAVEDFTVPVPAGFTSRMFEPMNNQIGGVMYRYSRLRAVLAGTTPAMTGTYFLSESTRPLT